MMIHKSSLTLTVNPSDTALTLTAPDPYGPPPLVLITRGSATQTATELRQTLLRTNPWPARFRYEEREPLFIGLSFALWALMLLFLVTSSDLALLILLLPTVVVTLWLLSRMFLPVGRLGDLFDQVAGSPDVLTPCSAYLAVHLTTGQRDILPVAEERGLLQETLEAITSATQQRRAHLAGEILNQSAPTR